MEDYQRFVKWFASLPAEGETVLLVKQAPKRGPDGEVMLHADGAIKATWPAFLPSHRGAGRSGEAWYGNTAAFVTSRFTEDRPSASIANCDYVLVMVLDDIGTKSKTPPIDPTWVMETSPENYQWGYAFMLDDQPTKEDFSAAIRAIADAGYTDPGACNPVRNFRIPGSVNLKPGRDGFEARLIEFHPERGYTLPQLCEAFNVVPGEASTFQRKGVHVVDDGGDDVVAWLSEQGLAYSRPNSEGWMGVHCPQADHHTDGSPEGRYLPSARAFCCLHSHCIDLDSAAFLRWVADQGGPRHTPGLREELLQARLSGALASITPTPQLAAEAAAVVAEVERKEAGRMERAEWFERYAYLEDNDAYFDLIDRREMARNTFNALFRHVSCTSVHTNDKGKGRRIEASTWYDEHRVAMGARSLAGVTYAAGETVLCAREGLVYGNRWRDARPMVDPSDTIPARWLSHLMRVIPNDAEREHVLDLMAFKVQNPNVKVNHAVLHAGRAGAGKDTAWAPFLWAIGGEALANVKVLDNEEMVGTWGYFLESEVIVLNELRQPEAADRRAIENKLKPIIAAPPEYLTVQRKGLPPYQLPNRAQVIAFSNDRGAISLTRDDRRWFVIWTDSPALTKDEADTMWNWYKAGGMAQCAAYLHGRDVSKFAPGAAPPMTEAKALMLGASRSMAEDWLIGEIEQRCGEFAADVVGGPWTRLCDMIQGRAPNAVRITPSAVLHALNESRWQDLGLCHSPDHPTKTHCFASPTWRGTKREARNLVAAKAPTKLAAVK